MVQLNAMAIAMVATIPMMIVPVTVQPLSVRPPFSFHRCDLQSEFLRGDHFKLVGACPHLRMDLSCQ